MFWKYGNYIFTVLNKVAGLACVQKDAPHLIAVFRAPALLHKIRPRKLRSARAGIVSIASLVSRV